MTGSINESILQAESEMKINSYLHKYFLPGVTIIVFGAIILMLLVSLLGNNRTTGSIRDNIVFDENYSDMCEIHIKGLYNNQTYPLVPPMKGRLIVTNVQLENGEGSIVEVVVDGRLPSR